MTIARRINAERMALAGWGRAILLQLAHPLVAAGVADHSSFTGGALQAALDRTVNNPVATTLNGRRISASLPRTVGNTATPPPGRHFSAAFSGESEAAGSASYLMQGDLLQSLAPVLQVRSDYFRIRTCGEALDASGKVVARAWCEAFVQRTSDYVDPQDDAHLATAELRSNMNQTFGRNFRIVSFRWLNISEI
jgi:hypothetical protein